MKRRRTFVVFMAFVLVFSTFPKIAWSVEQGDEPEQEVFLFPQADEVAYEPQVVLVELNGDATADEASNAIEALGYECTVEEVSQGVLRMDFASTWEAEEAVNALLEQGIVVAAQPNYEYSLMTDDGIEEVADPDSDLVADEPLEVVDEDSSEEEIILDTQATSVNDTRYGEQWGLQSTNVASAWDLAKGNHAVTVATLDLGCDVNHQDLKANIVDPYNSTNKTTNVTPVTGTTSNKNHGTHVAGVIAGVANNGMGIAGVSYNANVMPVKVVRDNGMAYTDELLNAYDYVISKKTSRNVRVINLSMGSCKAVQSDDVFVKKIAEAYDKGIVTVAAAGNKGASTTGEVPYTIYPADYPLIVSVINLEKTQSGVGRWHTSNYNFSGEHTKDIAAPGAGILSTTPGNTYTSMTGTSMAAPLVSGVLALEFVANPNLTPTAAVERLYATTTKLTNNDFDQEYGWGEVDAYRAVYAAKYGADATRLAKVRKMMASEGIPSQVFADVSSVTSHYEDIYWLAETGISAGWETSNGRVFRPYANVTRADMAAFLFRLAKTLGLANDTWQASSVLKKTFRDVNTSTPHATEIWWLASMGISEGWSTGGGKEFRPYQNVARADMAAFIHRLAIKADIDYNGSSLSFIDVNTRTPHCDDIRWLSKTGISRGWSTAKGREFRPFANTARADMAYFLHKLYNLQ